MTTLPGGRTARSGGEEPDPLADVDDRLAAGDLDGVRAAIRALPERAPPGRSSRQVGAVDVDRFAAGRRDAEGRPGLRAPRHHGLAAGGARAAAADIDRIWVNPLRLLNGGFRRLRHPAARSRSAPSASTASTSRCSSGLDADWDVVPFAYDWRLGIDIAAERARRTDRRSGAPAHLVAHSMGGLVCRMLRARHRESWDRLVDRGDDLARADGS